MQHTTVLPPSWWELPNRLAHERLLHLLLMSHADRDGIVRLDTAALAPLLGMERRAVYEACLALESVGWLSIYHGGLTAWAWLPHVAEYTPSSGKLKRSRDPKLPAPPRDAVVSTLEALWGRVPTTKEARSACPRAWGRTGRAAGSAPPPAADLQAVWLAWASRQKRPDACRLGAGAREMIRVALENAPADHLVLLVRFAYEADEPAPRFWRGANSHSREYLGLDNLLQTKKLPGRVQQALAWEATQHERQVDGDGTDMGPMAAYRRRGPAGTTSSPDPRPPRLSEQCRTMLSLFIERGPAGVRTSELAAIALKYTGRVSELRGAGYDIEVTERSADGNNLYVLNTDNMPQDT